VYTLPPTSSHLSFVSKANKVSENLWQAAKTFFSNIKYNRTFEEKLSCAHIMQKYTNGANQNRFPFLLSDI